MKTVFVVILTFIHSSEYTYCDFNMVSQVPLDVCTVNAQVYNSRDYPPDRLSRMLCLDTIDNSAFL
jgi:hypothetical protein